MGNDLGSINVIIDGDELVQICLDGLASGFGTISSAILAKENPPSFFELQIYCWFKKITSLPWYRSN